MSKRTIIIIVVILVFIAALAVTMPFLLNKNSEQTAPVVPVARTNQELVDAVIVGKPSLRDTQGKSRVAIIGQPQRLNNNWYIVRLKYIQYPNADGTTVLLYDAGGSASSLKLVLGPGTDFPDDSFAHITPPVPAIVKSEMNR